MNAAIIIPARYGSTRLPGKPLALILGKPMIQHVVERAQQVPGIATVAVATDDQRIIDAVQAFGGLAHMTSQKHQSGTDRIIELVDTIPADIYINLQGDEPLIRPADITLLLDAMQDTRVQVATLCHAINTQEAEDPNCVKVVLDDAGNALYFSRSLIPYPRNLLTAHYLNHVGIYGYRKEVLSNYGKLTRPMIEQTEELEQLRLMTAGIKIRVIQVAPTGPAVDTPECLERVRRLMTVQAMDQTISQSTGQISGQINQTSQAGRPVTSTLSPTNPTP